MSYLYDAMQFRPFLLFLIANEIIYNMHVLRDIS